MKRSGSDWDLEEFLRPREDEDDDRSPSPPAGVEEILGSAQRLRSAAGVVSFSDVLDFDFSDGSFAGSHYSRILKRQFEDALSRHSPGVWSQNISSRHSSISATIESQSSMCGSPTSFHKPKDVENQALGGTSGSDQSDDESLEIEAGLCDLSANVIDLKRMRRMVSNRESARRSRKRKQAHLAELELQVDQLRGDNATLYKQLTDANQQFGEAATDNRVLKSDVEALRVKVKMAEDLVTRGSLTSTLDHLLHTQIGSVQLVNPRHQRRASNLTCYDGAPAAEQIQAMGSENGAPMENGSGWIGPNGNPECRISGGGEVASSEADMWSWDSHANAISKQL